MESKMTTLKERMKLPAATQIGIVVPDLEKAIVSYGETFSLGPFERIGEFRGLGYHETFYAGKPVQYNAVFAFFKLGPMEVEVIQPLSGRTIYHDFLDAGRQGLHHVGFDLYGDFDDKVKAFAEAGINVLMNGRGPNRAFAYLDTENLGGVIFELLQRGGPRKRP